MIASVASGLGVLSFVYRACIALCPRYAYHKNLMTIKVFNLHHPLSDYVRTDFLSIVDHIPKIFPQLLCIYILRQQRPVSPFLYTEQNYTAVGIGKG